MPAVSSLGRVAWRPTAFSSPGRHGTSCTASIIYYTGAWTHEAAHPGRMLALLLALHQALHIPGASAGTLFLTSVKSTKNRSTTQPNEYQGRVAQGAARSSCARPYAILGIKQDCRLDLVESRKLCPGDPSASLCLRVGDGHLHLHAGYE